MSDVGGAAFAGAAPEVVDVHAHVCLPPLLAPDPASLPEAPARARAPETPVAGERGASDWSVPERLRPSVTIVGGRQVVASLGGRPVDAIVDELSRIEVVLSESRERGVDALIVSPWVATLPSGLDLGAARALCTAQNLALADVVASSPSLVEALGAVPLQDPSAAAEVLAQAVASGLVGAEITPSTGGRWLGDDAMSPFWEAAEALRAVVFVHPSTRGLGIDVFDEYYLWNAVANPQETAIAAAHLVMAGVLERYPHLAVVLAHGGGTLAGVAGRLDRAWRVRPEARARLECSPLESLARLHVDTVTHDPTSLASLVASVGADHVLLGSDRPFDMGRPRPADDVRSLGLSSRDEALVLGANAVALAQRVRRG